MKYLFLGLSFILVLHSAQGQSDYVLTVKKYQDSISEAYKNPVTSILSKKQRRTFDGLDFYPIQQDFRLSARFRKTPTAKPFNMSVSSGKSREYVQYGIAFFEIEGVGYQLPIYQNTSYQKNPDQKYGNSLFLPFTDYTSGDGSYGGGRYIDLVLEDIKEGQLVIDFNKAYNPYCAYTVGYSCPIPPASSNLNTRIEVGVKDFDGDY